MTSIRHMDAAVPPPPAPRRLNADQVAAFESDGLLFLPGLFSAAEMAPLARLARDDARITDNTIEVIDSTGQGAELFGWSGVTDDLLGAYVRIARLVEATEDLLGGQAVYHWHSKLTFKRPGSEGRWDWHQDYGSWYREGCLRPEMLTAMVAVDRCTRENGCVELVRGSHLLGRVDHVAVGDSHGADPAVVERALAAMDRVWCELEPGDGVFFHGNTLHASGPNRSEAPRTVLHVSYNTMRNAPARGYTNHAYAPLETLPDDILERHGYADDIDAEAMAASREAWRRGHDTLGNIYGYDVIRGADD